MSLSACGTGYDSSAAATFGVDVGVFVGSRTNAGFQVLDAVVNVAFDGQAKVSQSRKEVGSVLFRHVVFVNCKNYFFAGF